MTIFKNKKTLQITLLLLSPLFVVLLWALLAHFLDIPLILPMPHDVFRAFFALIRTPAFWKTLWNSVLHIYSGCAVGILIGFAVGLVTYRGVVFNTLLSPIFSIIRSTPVACFIIVAWTFTGAENLPYYISLIMVAPVMMTATQTGMRSTPSDLLEAAQVYQLSLIKRIRTCFIPSLLPHLFSAMVNCIGLAWKAGIAAEVITRVQGTIGYEIYDARSWSIDSANLFAWTLAVILISLAFEYLFKWSVKKFGRGNHT